MRGEALARTILVTGGAGFIGSHLIRDWLLWHPTDRIINIDALTYAGNLHNLQEVEGDPRYLFLRGDIADPDFLERVFQTYEISHVIHLAAESHVDRSIRDPLRFVQTNVLGTVTLLHTALKAWSRDLEDHRFYHVSTDEVYGSLGDTGFFTESTAYDPRSPYSASKAASDHFVRAYHHTYGMNVVISNCSNNYGPQQFPEKLLPLVILAIRDQKPIPVYGKGENIRDWLYVSDHVSAISIIFDLGRSGQTYNIGASNEHTNLSLIRQIGAIVDRKLQRPPRSFERLITFVQDRPGHDRRYAIDATKLMEETGWQPNTPFERGLETTIDWYLTNDAWVQSVTSGEYRRYAPQTYRNGDFS